MFVGIDPGKAGAIAFVYADNTVQSWRGLTRKRRFGGEMVNMYDVKRMHRLIKLAAYWRDRRGCKVHVALERQAGRPVTSKLSVLEAGKGLGIWLALLDLYNFADFTWLSPTKWKTAMGLSKEKRKSLELCAYLYPEHHLPVGRDEARAEAILIAEFLKRQLYPING